MAMHLCMLSMTMTSLHVKLCMCIIVIYTYNNNNNSNMCLYTGLCMHVYNVNDVSVYVYFWTFRNYKYETTQHIMELVKEMDGYIITLDN